MDTRRVLAPGAIAPVWPPHFCGGGGAVNAATQQVPSGYREVALASRVPPESLYSVALAENIDGAERHRLDDPRRRTGPGCERPWPWTINVAGKGVSLCQPTAGVGSLAAFFENILASALMSGLPRSIWAGNGHHFTSTREAFDPCTPLQRGGGHPAGML